MAARKLQQEMDRVFKKVAEGVLAFDSIYDKVQQSTNPSQKEKLEQDLKREIKRLQKLRDQIKTWMGNNDIKDKKTLTEQRKLIETEMERFKACEREMKTKAYSREGLTSSKSDPREKEKAEVCDFLQSMLEDLERQTEGLEAEQESLQSTMKKGRKDMSKSERISEIDATMERHKWHVSKMEIMLRMVENDTLPAESVRNLQEDIKYYVESNQDVDFAEDEEIYDDLKLEDDEDFDPDAVLVKDEGNSLEDLADEISKEAAEAAEKGDVVVPAVVAKENVPAPKELPTGPANHVHAPITSAPSSRRTSTTISPIVSQAPLQKAAPTPSRYVSASSTAPIPQGLSPLPPPPKGMPASQQTTAPSTPVVEAVKPVVSVAPAAPWADREATATITSKTSPAVAPAVAAAAAASTAGAWSPRRVASPLQPSEPTPATTPQSNGVPSFQSFNLPPGLQDLVHAFEAVRRRISSPPPISSVAKLLETSFLNCPDSSLADRPRFYHPESPFPTPVFYSQEPLTNLDDPAIMAKMDIDTLFYIFYYRQGTHQQYLAAKELKSRSWRFHKLFLTWFQRQEEPKVISAEYEQGAYRFFDFEGSWMQRRKANFKFEYQYLEDEV